MHRSKQAIKNFVIAGGVGANRALRRGLQVLAEEMEGQVYFPRLEFCTDNGAMIAYAGACRLASGQQQALEINVRPRWSLEDLAPL